MNIFLHMLKEQELVLSLLQLAMTGNKYLLSRAVDWQVVMDFSIQQGVSAIALDGLKEVGTAAIPDEVKFEWFSECLNCERQYVLCKEAIRDLAKFYEGQGIKMLLLKGYGLSLNYPIPSHRPVGDIDVYLFGLWNFADKMVEKRLGAKVDRSHHHHTVFNYKGFMVENHYDFINTAAHRDAQRIEARLKELAEESVETEIDGVKFYLPSANFNAIFLVRHAGQHFAGERITLRQLLDWGLFIEKHSAEVDWEMVLPFIKQMGCWKFFCALNGICKDALGISAEKFPDFERAVRLEERVLNDILEPEFSGSGSGPFIKFRRWCANIWKHRIVYDEQLLPMFCRLAWSHLRKPDIS